jgi:diguanylate cyclase (GGDEF)-like protein
VRILGRISVVPAWSWALATTFVLAAIFLLLPPASWLGAAIYIAVGLAELVAVFVGIRRHRPATGRSWRLMMCGAGLYTLANVVWAGWPVLLHRHLPFPSVADALFVAAYLCFVAGLAVLIRARSGAGEGLGALIDAAIVTVGVGVLAWEYLIGPLGSAAQGPTLARAVSLTYPMLDLALVALAARVFFTRGLRAPAFWLVCGFVVGQLAADATYMVTLLHDSFYYGHPLMVGWLVSFGCLGAAALHPSMRSLSDAPLEVPRTNMSWTRLLFLAVAALIVPCVFLFHGGRGNATELLIATVTLFVLCIGRMAVLFRELDRKATSLERREQELHSTVDLLHESERSLVHMAHHDALTGLPNRTLFGQRLDNALARADRSVAVMLLDIDAFKTVNDSLGHTVGDALLVAIAGRLASALRVGDTVARLGGDEFIVLAEGLDEHASTGLALRLLRTLDEPFDVDGRRVFARASLGIAACAGGCADRELVRDADTAMYEAKRKGGHGYEMFSAGMHARTLDRLALECDLRAAELGAAITVHYQPLVDLRDGQIFGLEALLRWRHPERGEVSPEEFIPIAEETGMIVPMGLWVLQEACRQARAWAESHPSASPLGMSVNVSACQLAAPQFVDDVARTLEVSGLDPKLLTIEITETMTMADENDVYECLHRLKHLGVRISLDDFGTGYSSLGHLQRFPIDELKLDRSFVATLGEGSRGTGSEGAGVASATIRLAQSLRIEVVAEGIERGDQLAELQRYSCTRGQGYYFWKPMDADAVSALLEAVDRSALPPSPSPKALLIDGVVIDEDATFRSMVGGIVSHAGFETVEATTGRTAVELAG